MVRTLRLKMANLNLHGFKLKISSLIVAAYLLNSPVSVLTSWGSHSHENSPCASLFTNGDYTGTQHKVVDGMTYSDVSTIPIWNTTKSVRIHPACTLTFCQLSMGSLKLNVTTARTSSSSSSSSSDLCHKFIKDTNQLPEEWHSESGDATTTAHCTCTKKCDCNEISLRRKECARAYLENDCNACNSFYTNLKKRPHPVDSDSDHGHDALPVRLQDKVRAVIVRPGCTLQLLNSTSGQMQRKISGQIVQDWNGDLGDYRCTCDPGLESTVKPSTSARTNWPEMLDVPKTAGSINSLLNTQRYKDHPGLTAALQSLTNKRSPKHAYILALGLTGAGKSTTINFLFDNSNITRVGDGHSVTTDIHEYSVPVPVPEFGLQNTELRIIDTPGILDTRGLEQDARYAATLDEYLKRHEDLKRSIPNVVLIFFKFDENRFSGYGSNFVKMLRTIDLFRDRIMDKKFTNVIFVATHYMSESREIVRRPHERLAAIKKVIQEYTLFPAPIVISLAENKPEGSDLLSVNGYYALPNGEFYPKNLFDRIQLVTSSGGDPIGEAIIRSAFVNSDYSHVGPNRIIESVFPLVAPTHSKVIEYLGTLSSLNTNPRNTPVSVALQRAYDALPNDSKKELGELLGNVQRTFYVNRISSLHNLPRNKEELFRLLKQIPRNPIVLQLLRTALNLTVPTYEPVSFLGYGYNLLEDVSLPTSPFDLPLLAQANADSENSDWAQSDVDFMMHKLYRCDLLSSVNTIFLTFSSAAELTEYRLESILGSRHIPQELLTTASTVSKPGLNLIDFGNEASPRKLSSVIEYQTFSLNLDREYLKLSDEFKSTLRALPEFNETDYASTNAWKEFLSKYGTHVVDSCIAGGYIEVIVRKAVGQNETDSDLFSTHQLLTEGTSKIIDHIAGLMIGKESLLNTSGFEYDLHFAGGNSKYYLESLSDVNAKVKLQNWKDSLSHDPVLLSQNSEFTLLSVGEEIEKDGDLGWEEALKFQNAATILFNGSLNYKPSSKSLQVYAPLDRSQTEGSATGGVGGGDFLVLKEFAQLLQKMSEEAQARNERFLATMMQIGQEMERKAAEEEEKRRNQTTAVLNAHQRDFEQQQAQSLATAAAQREQDDREDQDRSDKFEADRIQFLQSSEAAAQRQQQFTMFLIESNQKAQESRRQNSFWNKVADNILPIASNALMGYLIGAG